jgi:hypothetical protein
MAKQPFAKQRLPQKNPPKQWLPVGVEVRKIGISIPGYDPDAITRAQQQKRAEHRRRLDKRAERQRLAEQQATNAATLRPSGTPEEVEALSAAAAALAVTADLEAQLLQAFGGQPPAEAGSDVDA